MSYRASAKAYDRKRVNDACQKHDRVMAEIPSGLSEADYRNYLARAGFDQSQIDRHWKVESEARAAGDSKGKA
jgi:hypothetical protein